MEPSNSARPTKQLFILAGQSNMSGRGGVHNQQWDGVVPPESAADGDKIFRLNAHLKWEVAHEPLHQGLDANRTCGVGPGLAFANAVKHRVGAVGLVPCAVAGTQIKEWVPGTELYKRMVERAKEAADGGELRALLWYQGEKDTFLKEDADAYRENLESLIFNLRQDLNSPSLPVIVVAVASGRENIEKVREAQKGIISEVENVVSVDGLGLPLQQDNLHLTTHALIQLGHMMAHSFLNHFQST